MEDLIGRMLLHARGIWKYRWMAVGLTWLVAAGGCLGVFNKNLDSLRLQFTELHPDIVGARRLLAQLEARKAEEARISQPAEDPARSYGPVLAQLKLSLADTEAKMAAIRVRVQEYAVRQARLEEQRKAVLDVESQLAQLNRDHAVNKDHYEKLVARREEAKLSGDLSSSAEMVSFKIIDPPKLPQWPVGPKRRLMYSAVLLLALLAGPGAAMLLSQTRPTFVSPSALRDMTGLNELGTVAMSWSDPERLRLRRGQYALGASLSCLMAMYVTVMTAGLLPA